MDDVRGGFLRLEVAYHKIVRRIKLFSEEASPSISGETPREADVLHTGIPSHLAELRKKTIHGLSGEQEQNVTQLLNKFQVIFLVMSGI